RSSLSILRPPHTSKLFPYTTLFRSLLKSLEGHHNRPRLPLSNPEPFPFSVPSSVCAVSRGRCGLAKAGFVGGLHVGLFTGDLLLDRKSTRLNSSHVKISYAVFCLKK